MSLSGNLADVSVADILQFIHLGGRSGTLSLASGSSSAEIGFHRGRIVSARGPSSERMGEMLVRTGVVTQSELNAALRAQERIGRPAPVGRLLVELGTLTDERLREAAERFVEQSVFEVVGWTRGTFAFAVDEIRPVDDLAMSPLDMLPEIQINTQMVLLEAARIFDERDREEQTRPPEMKPAPRGAIELSNTLPESTSSVVEITRAAGERRRTVAHVQLLSDDVSLIAELGKLLEGKASVARVRDRDAGTSPPGESAPVVVVDGPTEDLCLERLATIRRTRPRATPIAVYGDNVSACKLYIAGALATVPRDAAALAACIERVIADRGEGSADRLVQDELRSNFARFRRLFGELRSGLMTATVSLNLMKVISESVDRAILFLVRRNDLLVLGSFGHGADGRALHETVQRQAFLLPASGFLAEGARAGRSHTASFEEARLPDPLPGVLGRPASGDCAVFPIVGGRRVMAVVYADNGRKNWPLGDLEFLELATSQAGVAYENELLRRRASRVNPDPAAVEAAVRLSIEPEISGRMSFPAIVQD